MGKENGVIGLQYYTINFLVLDSDFILYNLFGIRRKADASTFFNFRGIIV